MAPTPSTRGRAVPFAAELIAHGERVALIAGDRQLTYTELSEAVATMRTRLGPGRRLVLVEGSNTLDAVVTYLAALSAAHPVLLVPGGRPDLVESFVASYDPDVVVATQPGLGWQVHERRPGTVHELHPDLALLMSTSGSTGSPKLVRLSHDNLQANVSAIAEYLQLRPEDRGVTTLPMHYCYGLSVINSHLLVGAGVVLTELSVVDECFWQVCTRHEVSSLSGVPYTFDLLDHVGFAQRELPHLRTVTQAGGRLAPERVREYARLGRRRGWDLYVMYGQTEATARMAYLPPELAETDPETIGVPVPGGSLTLEPVEGLAGPGVGELVYTGPNVMLGYARTPADLALGRTVDRLHTGDLARRTPDGRYEIVGRRSRFAKVLGLRLDLAGIEATWARRGVSLLCAEAEGALVLAVEGPHDVEAVRQQTARSCGLPARAVRTRAVPSLPRLTSGKPDHGAVAELAAAELAQCAPARDVPAGSDDERTADLVRLYAELLARPEATERSSFTSLGGDSLSYVEMSVRLEERLGHLPAGWHTRSIRELAATPTTRPSWGRSLETGVVLRALAIVLVVGSHIKAFTVLGGAHVLLALAGYSYARFHLDAASRSRRWRGGLRSAARVAVPSMAFIAILTAVTGAYGTSTALLLDSLRGPTSAGRFWFVDVLVYLLTAVTAAMAVPWVDRWERSWPFAVPVVLVLVALAARYQLIGPVPEAMRIYTPWVVFWLFALGWAAAKATRMPQRLAVTALTALTVPGFFEDAGREAVVVAGICLLVWLPTVRVPSAIGRTLAVLASSSLFIYLSHWHVYPYLQERSRVLALAASLAVGVAYWWAWTRAAETVKRRLRGTLPAGRAPTKRHLDGGR